MTMLDQLRELTLPEVRDRLEARIDALIGRAVDNDDMRSEDEISRGIVRALRDDLPIIRYQVGPYHAVVRFVAYKQFGIAERDQGDIGLVVDLRMFGKTMSIESTISHQGIVFIESKLISKDRRGYRFGQDQIRRLAERTTRGLPTFVAFFEDKSADVNSHLLSGPTMTRASLMPVSFVYDVVGSRLRADLPVALRASLTSQMAFRWMQCHDLALSATAVRDGLNAHASSYIHAKVGLATSYEMALVLASRIENIVVPDHVMDVCTRNRSLCLEFDRLTHWSPHIGQSHEFERPDLGGLGL